MSDYGLQLVMFDTQGNVAFGLLDDNDDEKDDEDG